jgi:hypothetical protein
MRVLVSFLLVCVPSFAGTIYLDASCSGEVTTYTSDSASCGSYNPGASAEVSVTGQYVSAGAWAGYGQSASASASFTQDYVFTVWGGSGDGFAEPLLMVQGDRQGSDSAGASASLGGCELSQGGSGPPLHCNWASIPFEYNVPQILTLSLSAGADAYPYQNGTEYGTAEEDGFTFFDTSGNPLGGVPYSFDPVPAPEPGTLPLLTAMACAAIIAVKRRRQRR